LTFCWILMTRGAAKTVIDVPRTTNPSARITASVSLLPIIYNDFGDATKALLSRVTYL